MPSTVDSSSPTGPVRPLPTREPLPDTLARPPIRLAWKEAEAVERAAEAVAAEAEGSAAAPPVGAVSRLLTALAVRLIAKP